MIRLLFVLVLAIAAPAQAQFTAFMSEQEEKKVGAQEHPKILDQFGGVYDGNQLDFYVASIGGRLVARSDKPNEQYHFTLLNSPVMNAMALPGGYVYVTRGIVALANSEAELAGVIGHEIGHVTARHAAQRYSQATATSIGAGLAGILGSIFAGQAVGELAAQAIGGGGMLWLSSNSREHENEADRLGLVTMARTGYAPVAVPEFLQSLNDYMALEARLMGRPGAEREFSMLQTHPRTADRVRATMAEAQLRPAEGALNRDEYLSRIDGMLYGDDPRQGLIRGSSFAHPDLRIAFAAPQGWYLMNGETQVTGIGPNGARFAFDNERDPRRVQASRGDPLDYIGRIWLGGRVQLAQAERFQVSGLTAGTARARVQSRQGQTTDARFVAIMAPNAIWRFLFLADPRTFAGQEGAFRSIGTSFRILSPQEAAALKPQRLRIVQVRAGDTEESLAARMPYGAGNREWFRVLNGLRGDEQIKPGDRVKIVTE